MLYRLIRNRPSKNTEVILMVLTLLRIPRRNSRKTGTRMLLFKIFVLKASKVIKTKDSLVPTTPTEALPKGVGAGGSDYMEVSPKYPGARLEGYWKVWESLNVHPREVLVRLLSSFQTKTTPDPVSGNRKQLLISSKTESFAGVGSTNG